MGLWGMGVSSPDFYGVWAMGVLATDAWLAPPPPLIRGSWYVTNYACTEEIFWGDFNTKSAREARREKFPGIVTIFTQKNYGNMFKKPRAKRAEKILWPFPSLFMGNIWKTWKQFFFKMVKIFRWK